jgi:hypothetical protein
MRAAITACLATAVLVCSADAATDPTLLAAPKPVGFGETLTAKGRHWPVIEFCRRTIHLRLRSAQNAFEIGIARVSASGRWRLDYKVRRSEVGAGHWTLVARLPCESGNDGAPNPVRRTLPLTIR